jgi:uncharacterized protein YajQ (UPF0234 family)
MPSFDFSSEADMAALHNAIDVTRRAIDNRYDFKGTSAKVELNEKDNLITLHGDSDFQLGQIKDLLFPAMEKKEKESTKRLEEQPVQRVSGNKVKQDLKIRIGIESELAKKIVKLIKDSKLKVQASIQGDAVRVSGAKRDELQACIATGDQGDYGFSDQVRQFSRLIAASASEVCHGAALCLRFATVCQPARRKAFLEFPGLRGKRVIADDCSVASPDHENVSDQFTPSTLDRARPTGGQRKGGHLA